MLSPILLSLKISIISTVFTLIISILITKFITNSNSTVQNIIETLLTLPLVLPPSAIGYVILMVFSKSSFFGKFLSNTLDIQIIFSWIGGVIAASIVSLPLMYQSIKGSIINIDNHYLDSARMSGASELQVFFHITLPLAWPGVLSGIILTFARSLGEFGATLMVIGNIPGKTQTIPIAMYFAVEGGDITTANHLLILITLLSLLLTLLLNIYVKRKLSYI